MVLVEDIREYDEMLKFSHFGLCFLESVVVVVSSKSRRRKEHLGFWEGDVSERIRYRALESKSNLLIDLMRDTISESLYA